MKPLQSALAALVLLLAPFAGAHAEDLFMVRSDLPFPETMATLQDSIRQHGYVVTRVQRVDIGLIAMGYKTDKYRVVFFAKLDETQRLAKEHPELIPYLPQKISIFAEEDQTVLIASNPAVLKALYPDRTLAKQFDRWENDLRSIFEEFR